jgi:hypothetical protein
VYRKRIIRAFALKQTHWYFEEQQGRKWIPVVIHPLRLSDEDDYRIVITDKKRRIRPGKTPNKKKQTNPSAPPKIEKPTKQPLIIERSAPPPPPKEPKRTSQEEEPRRETYDLWNPKFNWSAPATKTPSAKQSSRRELEIEDNGAFEIREIR